MEIQEAVRRYLQTSGFGQMALKTAMFDMDGVLFDSMRNHARCWHETMTHFGFDFPEWEAFLHEGRTGGGTINIVSQRERGHDATAEEIEEMYRYKSELFDQCPEAEPMPGAYSLLKKVKGSGITPMVVTGSGQHILLKRLQKNFPDIFRQELMVTAFDVKKGKPDPEPYLMGLEKGGCFLSNSTEGTLKANESIVIENAPLGVEAGVAAGVFTIAVNTGPLPDETLYEAGANLLFPSMQALCDQWEELLGALQKTTTM